MQRTLTYRGSQLWQRQLRAHHTTVRNRGRSLRTSHATAHTITIIGVQKRREPPHSFKSINIRPSSPATAAPVEAPQTTATAALATTRARARLVTTPSPPPLTPTSPHTLQNAVTQLNPPFPLFLPPFSARVEKQWHISFFVYTNFFTFSPYYLVPNTNSYFFPHFSTFPLLILHLHLHLLLHFLSPSSKPSIHPLLIFRPRLSTRFSGKAHALDQCHFLISLPPPHRTHPQLPNINISINYASPRTILPTNPQPQILPKRPSNP